MHGFNPTLGSFQPIQRAHRRPSARFHQVASGQIKKGSIQETGVTWIATFF